MTDPETASWVHGPKAGAFLSILSFCPTSNSVAEDLLFVI